MKPPSIRPLERPSSRHVTPIRWAVAALLALHLGALAQPFLQSDHDNYYPGEAISVAFRGGPGNTKDWIGVYPADVPPGPGSTIWRYVDNTASGNTGLREGTVTFPTGLALAGDWGAYLLENDGYTALATNLFRVVDPSSPLVRVGQRVYRPGTAITVTFTNGPANARDWVGIYKQGQTPGGPPSTLWAYVDGTQTGTTGESSGTLTFGAGLTEPGPYVAHFFVNDTYDILSTETFEVQAATGSVARVLSVTPADGATNQLPAVEFSAVLTNGATRVVPATIRVRLDGAEVPAVVQAQGDGFVVTYTGPGVFAPDSAHTWQITAQDSATPPNTLSAESRIQVRTYVNVVLSTPVHFENFDAVPEGSLPTGWTQKSYTTPITETEDFGDLGSLAFSRWTAVNVARFEGSFVTYGNPDNPDSWESDYQRVLRPNPANVVNGQVFSGPLATGRMLFGNSGYQNGSASQVLYLFTRDYDLTGKTNVHLGFHSLWEQNQDSIAAIEYSVDRGATWLPVAYFIDRNDIVTIVNEATGEQTVDAEATFTEERADTARYVDDLGNEVGGTYGAFIGAAISPALAPFIQGRVDDNPVESKRVEWYRLPAADRQAAVRFRFAHAGTDSWYFGIDDFGLYAPATGGGERATLTVVRDGGAIVVSWPASAAGSTLESSPSLSPATWTAVPGVTGTSHRVETAGGPAFYRLRQ